MPIDEAVKLFGDAKQSFKVELLRDIKSRGTTKLAGGGETEVEVFSAEKPGAVSIYRTGKFLDLCRGPHVESAREIPADGFKLNKLAAAYWRGNEHNPQLQRVYGLAFVKKSELEEYLRLLEEQERRDHRKISEEKSPVYSLRSSLQELEEDYRKAQESGRAATAAALKFAIENRNIEIQELEQKLQRLPELQRQIEGCIKSISVLTREIGLLEVQLQQERSEFSIVKRELAETEGLCRQLEPEVKELQEDYEKSIDTDRISTASVLFIRLL